jgi:hypothetical protein
MFQLNAHRFGYTRKSKAERERDSQESEEATEEDCQVVLESIENSQEGQEEQEEQEERGGVAPLLCMSDSPEDSNYYSDEEEEVSDRLRDIAAMDSDEF